MSYTDKVCITSEQLCNADESCMNWEYVMQVIRKVLTLFFQPQSI